MDLPTKPLPGEHAVDEQLLDGVVLGINRIHLAKGLETALSLGALLLGAFFDGDLERYRDKHKGHVSFRAMARRKDLTVSWSTCYYALAVLDQLGELPREVAGNLSFSHHRLLLPVKDPEAKADLARRAHQQQLTVRELADAVQAVRAMDLPHGSRTGRPRLPAVVKGVRRLRRAVEYAATEGLSEAAFSELSEDDRIDLLADLDRHLEAVAALRAKVRETLD